MKTYGRLLYNLGYPKGVHKVKLLLRVGMTRAL